MKFRTLKSHWFGMFGWAILLLLGLSLPIEARGYRSSTGYWYHQRGDGYGSWRGYSSSRGFYGWPSYYAYYGVPVHYTHPYYSSYYSYPSYYPAYTYSTYPYAGYYYQNRYPVYPIPDRGGIGVFYSR